ncbi:MAG: apolipoprotein N-acyltransferase, partial [Acidimicrobiia bacterium]
VLAFPPFGPGLLIVPGVTLFLVAIRFCESRRQAFWVGWLYGTAFFAGFMWWLAELELIALVLVPVQGLFYAAFAWWLYRFNEGSPGRWLLLAVGGWGFMELIRYHYPVGGLEWGAAGYALSDSMLTRFPAAVVGTSGLTILVVLISALLALAFTRSWSNSAWVGVGVALAVVGGSFLWWSMQTVEDSGLGTTIVQGSTPCPFERCPPNERLHTFEQHLELTESLQPGSAGLVVWPEGSTGSINADPVNNPEVGAAISAQARRLRSPFVVGSDRVLDDTHWVNANVYFDSEGNIVGEYRKQHPVPFGEYIPLRPLFQWIPALDRVPRDMIPGDGPVLFGDIGSIISFEGGFSRYGLGTRRAGAKVLIVNTNTASYDLSPASDVWIGMTRMRAVELGIPVIHAAVTGKSTVIDLDGSIGPVTDLGTSEILQDGYRADQIDTPYTATGDVVMYLAAVVGIIAWSFALGSGVETNHKE